MNERLKHLLDTYEDFELAFLSKYKLDSYMDGTRATIETYISERGLTEEKMAALRAVTEQAVFLDRFGRCPRCKSKKFTAETVELNGNDRGLALDGVVGRAHYGNKIVCNICDYSISDPNGDNPTTKSALRQLFDYIGSLFG